MSSSDIYTLNEVPFQPTYLYIKQHLVTGKLYFGKTGNNPEKYYGSGSHWKNHIQKHGKQHISTLWYCLFCDQNECTKFALMFSEQNQIVESTEWLNMVVENGSDGCPIGTKKGESPHKGRTYTEIYGKDKAMLITKKMSDALIGQPGRIPNKIEIQKRKDNHTKYWKGKHHSEETKKKISQPGEQNAMFGKCAAKCAITGNKLGAVVLSDPRWASGEIIACSKGENHSPETKKLLSIAHKGKKQSPEVIAHRAKMNTGKKRPQSAITATALKNTGRKHSPETCQIMKTKAISRAKQTCEYCGLSYTTANYAQWHGIKCKNYSNVLIK